MSEETMENYVAIAQLNNSLISKSLTPIIYVGIISGHFCRNAPPPAHLELKISLYM